MIDARQRAALVAVSCALVLCACGAGAAEPKSSQPAAPPEPVSQAAGTGNIPRPVFDSARAWADLQKQVAFGPRPAGSQALAACRTYILSELAAAGIETRQQVFDADTPLGTTRMVNLIATIPGQRPERIILATHYDTKLFRDIRFVGASDGASSTAAVLELARALKGRRNQFTIELLFLDGEEAVVEWAGNDHTYGSRHYVSAAQRDGTLSTAKALVLLDMIGDRDLDIRRDANSTPWLVDVVWAAAERLGHRSTFVNELTTIEDDHVPFVRAGVPSVDIIDLNYAQWHTQQDDLDHVSADSGESTEPNFTLGNPEIRRTSASRRSVSSLRTAADWMMASFFASDRSIR